MNIVITGGSSGIGKTVGDYLVSKGHHVIGTSRNKTTSSSNFELLQLDVTNDESVNHFVEGVLRKLGTIDVLINNAGNVISGPIENTSIEECKKQFETNYFGTVRVTQKFLPQFRAQQKGTIINISSMAGLIGMPFQAQYSASKFALEGFTEALRLELLPFNINVCNINPGDFKTAFTANRKLSAVIGDDYKDRMNHMMAIYEHDENNGSDPIKIAQLIESLIRKKRLNIRYVVGQPSQTIAITLKRIFGPKMFESVMKRMWKI